MTVPPDPQEPVPFNPMSRRAALILGAGALAAGGAVAAQWFNIFARNNSETLTPGEAHAAALRGDVLLVDIRRPDEWTRTGIPEGGIALDMRRPDFVQALRQETAATDQPIALICARGVRSRAMSERLAAEGFQTIIDVPEGMLGSGAGPGWLGAGLPVRSPPS